MRRALTIAGASAALAGAATGCGSSAKSPLDDALGYLPKSTPIVVALNTNTKDDQYRRLDTLLKRFPFYGLIKQQVQRGITIGGRKTAFSDLKPLLGNDFVIGFPNAGKSGGTSGNETVVAWKTKDGSKAASFVKRNGQKVGSEEGATLYQEPSGNTTAVKGEMLVTSKSRALVDAALKQRGKDDRLREDTFKAGLSGLPSDSIARVYGNFQELLSGSRAAAAKKVPWVAALRTFGATLTSASDGLVVDFRARTQGSVTPAQLPVASGTTAPRIVRRSNEIGIALRDPSQTFRFAEQALEAAVPQGTLAKATVARALGVDIDRDLIGALGPGADASVGLGGSVVVRADLKDPAKFNKTLATIARNLPQAGSLANGTKLTPGPNGLYRLRTRSGRPEFVGVAGKELVIGDDAGRAVKFASEPATSATGARGALAFALDPRAIATEILKRRAGASGALLGGAFVAPLKDLTGYAESEPSGLTARFKLTISP